jgi:hypothetical protein
VHSGQRVYKIYRIDGLHFLPLTRQVLWNQMDCLKLSPYSIPSQSTLTSDFIQTTEVDIRQLSS